MIFGIQSGRQHAETTAAAIPDGRTENAAQHVKGAFKPAAVNIIRYVCLHTATCTGHVMHRCTCAPASPGRHSCCDALRADGKSKPSLLKGGWVTCCARSMASARHRRRRRLVQDAPLDVAAASSLCARCTPQLKNYISVTFPGICAPNLVLRCAGHHLLTTRWCPYTYFQHFEDLTKSFMEP